jgi:hypothetical protein
MSTRYAAAERVADQLVAMVRGQSVVIPRMKITKMMRKVSRESELRVKSGIAGDIEKALLDKGIRDYPSLKGTRMDDNIRLFRAGSSVAVLIDAVLKPNETTNRKLIRLAKDLRRSNDRRGRRRKR